jgi:hypothetical protein
MNAVPPPRISFADLMETVRSLPSEVRADKNRLTFTLAVSVIRHFFGKQWFEDHIFQDAEHSRPPGFMRIDYTLGSKASGKRPASSTSLKRYSILAYRGLR